MFQSCLTLHTVHPRSIHGPDIDVLHRKFFVPAVANFDFPCRELFIRQVDLNTCVEILNLFLLQVRLLTKQTCFDPLHIFKPLQLMDF